MPQARPAVSAHTILRLNHSRAQPAKISPATRPTSAFSSACASVRNSLSMSISRPVTPAKRAAPPRAPRLCSAERGRTVGGRTGPGFGASCAILRRCHSGRGNLAHADNAAPVGSGMTDEELVERIAGEFVDRHGQDAVRVLEEQAEIADALGDMESAETWRQMPTRLRGALGFGLRDALF